MNNIKIGTSGFSFPDWRGIVYPETLKKEDALKYYANDSGFNSVEINSTYYTLVSEKSFAGMEKKTPPDFEFVVKAYKGTTHDPFDDRLGEKKPDIKKAEEDTRKFIYSLNPLREKNKLGSVLLQFPPFFCPGETSERYLSMCKEWFGDIPLAVEFRNCAWSQEEHYKWLEENKMISCTVDEPPLERLMPFVNRVTSDIAYFRFHGRNKNWFNAPVSERYDYLYSDSELESFIPEIKKAVEKTKKTYLFFNNCHRGSALTNAQRLKEMLGSSQKYSR